MRRFPALAPKTLVLAIAAAIAIAAGAVSYLADAWPRLENDSLDVRFGLAHHARPSDVAVVAIDDETFSALQRAWPFPRRLHAGVIDRLRIDGARAIVYDVQFSEPTDERDDLALFESIRKAHDVVLAATEVDAHGRTNVLGGEANLRRAHAVAAAANLPAEDGGVIRRYPYSLLGLRSLAVAGAHVAGTSVSSARFSHDKALIDFRGPPGTVPTISFSKVLRGEVPPGAFRGKIVVVGATAPTLQDVHQTSIASDTPMPGPEIQANAIWTALHQNPLQPAGSWLALLAIVLAGAAAPLLALRFRVLVSVLIAAALAALYLAIAQLAFDSGTVLVITYPLAAWCLGTIGMVAASYVAAFLERNAFARQLYASQLELIQRLAQAVETRDVETGEHVRRIGRLCRRLALELGWDPVDAERLQHASAMHDIGKIGVPDSILLKPGALSEEEWAVIRAHTTVGAEILAGSENPLVQMAQDIARSHHERWDGGGYPAGLAGEEIPLAARICAVVDVYDALSSKRSYKEAWSAERVLAELEAGSGSQFDPHVVAAFLRIAPQLQREMESVVATSDGSVSSPRPATA
ncbi:MAG TPA: CHASE2 domain-containing protein [Solirubrobacteraceae bacterium]|nr:CHASE2 domain-containing protein [Solirubrobacteraceae bacterium]